MHVLGATLIVTALAIVPKLAVTHKRAKHLRLQAS
jgi:hypothetical protein